MNGSLKARIQSECFFANQMNERPCLKQTPSWPQFFLFLLLEHFPPLFSTLPHRLICSTRLRCFILFIVDSMHNRRFKSSIYQLPEFLLLFQSFSSKHNIQHLPQHSPHFDREFPIRNILHICEITFLPPLLDCSLEFQSRKKSI